MTQPWPADQVERWPIDRLVPYARNARTHSEAQVAQIAAAIRAWGWTAPILVDEAGGLIAGHGRVLAARQLGIATIPVMVARGWSEAQKRSYIIADNRLAELAGWDEEILRLELTDLQGLGVDLGLVGFDADDLDRLLGGEGKTGLTEDDAVPEVPDTPVSRRGDLWILGPHRLLCGDATVSGDIERLMAGGRADLCFTDPPYNVDYGNSAKDKMRGTTRPILNDNLGAGFEAFLTASCRTILAVTDGAVYVCMAGAELATLQRAFRQAGGHWSTFIVWAKSSFTMGRADYQRQYEPILYGWREGADHYWCGARDQGDVWAFDRPQKNDLHPTMKPVALVERALRNSSKNQDVVLDPFGGSGTTLIAAEKLGRQARLIELDPRYCDVVVRRWQEWTGGGATLEGDGRRFEEVAGAREDEADARP